MGTRNNRIRIMAGLLALVLLAGLIGACTEPEPTTTPTTSAPTTSAPTTSTPTTSAPTTSAPTTSAPTTSEPEQTWEFIFSHGTPPQADLYKYEVDFCDKITELTDGRITFVHYASGALVPMDQYWPAIQEGTHDLMQIGTGDIDYHPSTHFTRLPFLGLYNMEIGTKIINDIMDKYPVMGEEYAEFGMLYHIRMMPPDMLHTTKKAVSSPSDLNGMKIGADEHVAPVVQDAGGAAIHVELPDRYSSLETGLIEGVWDHMAVTDAFGLTPLFKYHTFFMKQSDDITAGGSSMGGAGITWNWDSWNSLPSEYQDLIMSFREDYMYGTVGMDVKALEKAEANAMEAGAEFVYCSEEELAQWKPMGQSLYDDWLEKQAKLGKPGQEILDDVQALIEKYNQEYGLE